MRSVRPFYRAGLTVAALGLAALAGAAGCGDEQSPPGADAALPRRVLEVLAPAGGEVGLAFAERVELRVRYRDEAMGPLAGEPIRFTITTDAARDEAAGGSTLSASEAVTDADGLASATLVAGAALANFRVEANAPSAPTATVYVAVTDQGFASLRVVPRHVGPRAAAHFTTVEVLLYRDRGCEGLDPVEPPQSFYPPRLAAGFDLEARYDTVGAGVRHAALARGRDDEGRVLAAGCLALGAEQVRPGGPIRLDLPAWDRPAALETYDVASAIALAPVADAVLAGAPAWRALTCPLGPAQVVVDAALAALEPAGETALALAAARGAPDAGGCRPATTEGGEPSVDAAVTEALEGAAVPVAQGLADAAAKLVALLERLFVRSTMVGAGGGVRHTLVALGLDVGGVRYEEDAVASLRPIVEAPWVAVLRDGAALTLSAHGFTARLGWLVRHAFTDEVLAPAGLGAAVEGLGALLVESAAAGVETGCAAVGLAACAAAGLLADCLDAACPAAVAALDAELAAPFARLDAGGLDLVWSGAAFAADEDHDLVVDGLAGGVWAVELGLAGGEVVPASGSFTGVR